jgi:lipoate-protein ligase A
MPAVLQSYNLPDKFLIDGDFSGFHCLVWQPAKLVVVLGASNKMESSVVIEHAEADGVDVMKRPSGGESVVLSPRMLAVSVAFETTELKDPHQYFAKINAAIIKSLEACGVQNLLAKGISDIAMGEKKILGSSIYRASGRLLYHAVLNVSEDVSVFGRYLKHPAKEPDYRKNRRHDEFVTSLAVAGFSGDINSLKNALEANLNLI